MTSGQPLKNTLPTTSTSPQLEGKLVRLWPYTLAMREHFPPDLFYQIWKALKEDGEMGRVFWTWPLGSHDLQQIVFYFHQPDLLLTLVENVEDEIFVVFVKKRLCFSKVFNDEFVEVQQALLMNKPVPP